MKIEKRTDDVRVLKLDVTIAADSLEDKIKLTNKVRQYIRYNRYCLRKAALPLMLAQIQVEQWDDQKGQSNPNKATAITECLKSLTQKDTKTAASHLEPFLKEMMPTALSSLIQENTRAIVSSFMAKDPEVAATKRFLILQGTRRALKFLNFPLLIKAYESDHSCVKFWSSDPNKKDGVFHHIQLRWDKELDWVKFKIVGKRTESGRGLDSSRAYILRQISSGKFKFAGIKLQIVDGKRSTDQEEKKNVDFKLYIAYHSNYQKTSLPKERVLEVAFMPTVESFLQLSVVEGQRPTNLPVDDMISKNWSAEACITSLERLRIQQDRAKRLVSACMENQKARLAEQNRRDNITKARTNVCDNWAHYWSNCVAETAKSWECGTVRVMDFPSNGLFGHSFPWADFKFKVNYKCTEVGADVSFIEGVKVDDIKKELQKTAV